MKRRFFCALAVFLVMGTCAFANAQEERVQALETYLSREHLSDDEQSFVIELYKAALTEDGVDIAKIVDGIVSQPVKAEESWLGILRLLQYSKLEDAYETEMIARREEFEPGSYHDRKIESMMEAREGEAAAVEVMHWLAAQGSDFKGFSNVIERDVLPLLDALVSLSEEEQALWFPKVYKALKAKNCEWTFYRAAIPVLAADAELAPVMQQLMLPDYLDFIIKLTATNTKFRDEKHARTILDTLARAAHPGPGVAVDYDGLVEALNALDASDVEMIYAQLADIVSMIDGDYALLLAAYAESDAAVAGATLYDLLMGEKDSLMAQPTWTPENLRLFYQIDFPEDGLPHYTPTKPMPNHVLIVSPEKNAKAAQALFALLADAGLVGTSNPDEASFLLLYQRTHGAGGEYRKGSQLVMAQTTTATLIFADWSSMPAEYARISATNEPGSVIQVEAHAISYQAPAPPLDAAEGWEDFVANVRAATR